MYKRGKIWWIRIMQNGKVIQRSSRTSDRRIAKKIEAKIRVEIAEGKYFDRPIGDTKTIAQMMEKFMTEHAPTVSENMQESYKYRLKHILSFMGESTLTSVTRKQVSDYKQTRKNGNASSATINRELAMLSKAFNLAVNEWEFVKENPISSVPKEKEDNRSNRWLTNEEEEILLKSCAEWFRDFVMFAINTGMRRGEIINLEWSQVDMFRKEVYLADTKNDEPRTVPLSVRAFGILVKKAKVRVLGQPVVFLTESGNKIDPRNLKRCMDRILKKTGIQHMRIHDLRHTFGTRLAQAGVDLYTISKLMGHKDIRMTQRYAHHSTESLRRGLEVLDKC